MSVQPSKRRAVREFFFHACGRLSPMQQLEYRGSWWAPSMSCGAAIAAVPSRVHCRGFEGCNQRTDGGTRDCALFRASQLDARVVLRATRGHFDRTPRRLGFGRCPFGEVGNNRRAVNLTAAAVGAKTPSNAAWCVPRHRAVAGIDARSTQYLVSSHPCGRFVHEGPAPSSPCWAPWFYLGAP